MILECLWRGLLQTNEKGQVTVKGSVLKQMEDLKEETGLTCCICREGYRNQPTKVFTITSVPTTHLFFFSTFSLLVSFTFFV